MTALAVNTVQILQGDCREVLRTLADESVHCIVTSPPYYGLRDYGVAGQMGLESTPDEFIAGMVAVFRECRRVLRDDGTLWLNIGDSYANDGKWGGHTGGKHAKVLHCSPIGRNKRSTGLKPKDLIGIPWMLAFALRADGWFLREDIIWSKPNPMPESMRDRCTKAHEYLFLLSKSPRYYFDAEAIAEPIADSSVARLAQPNLENQAGSDRVPGKTNGAMKAAGPRFGGNKYGDDDSEQSRTKSGNVWDGQRKSNRAYSFARKTATTPPPGQAPQHRADREPVEYRGLRNKRSVWTVATRPFKEAHFATFPPSLIEPCILAGCPEWGTVLDPFGGAGTTGLVADRLLRNAVLIELNPEYAEIARRRIAGDAPLFSSVLAPKEPTDAVA
jgi:DNA modification methylase